MLNFACDQKRQFFTHCDLEGSPLPLSVPKCASVTLKIFFYAYDKRGGRDFASSSLNYS